MTAPRIIVRGATTAITRRATLRKAFLAPWHPGVGQAWLYSLALAQRHTDVALHHATCVITHQHLSVTPAHDDLPRFTQIAHHEFSCALNTLLARERYDQPGELFDGRATHMMRLCDDASQSTHLIYEYLNTTAAGLVSRPEHMPGFVFDFDLWLKGYIDVQRPDFYFSDRQPDTLRLWVTPPPLLYLAFDGNMDKLVHAMKRLAEQGIRELRARRGREPLGARAITRLHPWSEPRTLRETRGTRVPTFRIGARGIVGQQAHIEAALEVRGFRTDHRAGRIARRAGDLAHAFPYGTYAMRVHHGAPVADPELGTALVTRPGPTLRDVQRMLEQRAARHQAAAPEIRFDLVERTREALLQEADEICEHASDGMDFRGTARGSATPSGRRGDAGGDGEGSGDDAHREERVDGAAGDGGTRAREARVRHRFDRPPGGDSEQGARRIVTLRDRRRGRPSKSKSRHGSDPPA